MSSAPSQGPDDTDSRVSVPFVRTVHSQDTAPTDGTIGLSGISPSSSPSAVPATLAPTGTIRVLENWGTVTASTRPDGDVVWETEKRVQLLIPTNDGNIEREAYLSVIILPGSNGMQGFLRIANPGVDHNLTIDFMSCGYPYVPTTGLIVNYPLPLPSGRICTDDEGDADFQYPLPETVDAWAIARDRVLWWVGSKSDVELGALLLDIVFEDSKAFRGQIIAMVKDIYGAGRRLQRMNLDTTPDRRGSFLGILTRSVLSSMRSWL